MSSGHDGKTIVISSLPAERRLVVKQAMLNILSSKHAFDTFSQLAHGLPGLESIDGEIYRPWWLKYNPNVDPSQEAQDLVEAFRANLDFDSMRISKIIAGRFKLAALGSRAFSLRLIEIVAYFCHELAASLFENTEGGLHKLVLPEDLAAIPRYFPRTRYPPFQTLFYHPKYDEQSLYPREAADVAAYWAEAELFGGVVLFDRGPGQTGEEGSQVYDVYLHSLDDEVFRISSTQLTDLYTFLTSKNPVECCFPFRPAPFERIQYGQDAGYFNIYRTSQDRKSLELQRRPRDVVRYVPGEDEAEDRFQANIMTYCRTRVDRATAGNNDPLELLELSSDDE